MARLDEDAEKSAGRVLDGLARDEVQCWKLSPAAVVADVSGPCIRDAARSAAQSCVAEVLADAPEA